MCAALAPRSFSTLSAVPTKCGANEVKIPRQTKAHGIEDLHTGKGSEVLGCWALPLRHLHWV